MGKTIAFLIISVIGLLLGMALGVSFDMQQEEKRKEMSSKAYYFVLSQVQEIRKIYEYVGNREKINDCDALIDSLRKFEHFFQTGEIQKVKEVLTKPIEKADFSVLDKEISDEEL